MRWRETSLIRRLLPWQAKLGKRLVKTPKIYFRDSGLFHTLSGIHAAASLLTHPKLGASWEATGSLLDCSGAMNLRVAADVSRR